MFNKLAVFALLTLSTVYSADPIKFKGGDVAVSPTIKGKVTLYASPKEKDQPTHSQFLYEKFAKDPKKVSNAEVELYKGDTKVGSIDSNFDTISQKCGCYWLNATSLVETFPKMTDGDYHMVMKGDGYTVKSGIFSIVSGKTGADDKDTEEKSSKGKDSEKEDGKDEKEKDDDNKTKEKETDNQTSTGSSSKKETKVTDSSESDTNSTSTFKKESSSSKLTTTQSQPSNSLTSSPSFAAIALCIFYSYLKL
ncbi:hypothetical protein K502DRAFT_112453 [Neoconidiobolus thromboides FSU 785]|nr:hypothetical protein K502DRAFT_112453 [Neoconidiobolus thromboides FSU 785]